MAHTHPHVHCCIKSSRNRLLSLCLSSPLLQKAHPAAPTDVQQYNTHALAAVNYGLILFLQQQHATALSVLEPLFEEVDILQDGTGLCLCTLLLEIYLDCCQLPKAVEVLQYLQNQAAAAKPAVPLGADVLGVPAGDAGSSSSNQGSPSAVAARDSSSRSPSKQQEGQQAAGPAGVIEGQTGGQQQDGGGEQGPVVPLSQALPVLSKTKGQRMQEVGGGGWAQPGCMPKGELTCCTTLSSMACYVLPVLGNGGGAFGFVTNGRVIHAEVRGMGHWRAMCAGSVCLMPSCCVPCASCLS